MPNRADRVPADDTKFPPNSRTHSPNQSFFPTAGTPANLKENKIRIAPPKTGHVIDNTWIGRYRGL